MNEQMGLLAKKVGMTEFYKEDGTRVPVTVLLCKGNFVTAHRTATRDGYTALQLGFDEKRASRTNKPQNGQFKQAGVTPRYRVAELRVPAERLEAHPVGSEIPVSIFTVGTKVDVTGTSKGKGFQGVMKRHNFSGEKRSHGNHESFRGGGSVGCRMTPGRVLPGKRMSGQMGNERVTIQNLEVARVMEDIGVILVKGPVPGSADGYVTIRAAIKPALVEAHAKRASKSK